MKISERNYYIKCIVWDLDNTIWEGTLLEDQSVKLRDNIKHIIKTLDNRGILQSIASKNDPDAALKKLKEYGLDEYFLYPQISWNSKAESVKNISELLNIKLDSFAFIDDQQIELDEMHYELPDIKCFNAEKIEKILYLPEINPPYITDDSRLRRKLYMNDIHRNQAEKEYKGPTEEFLKQLKMKLTIFKAQKTDLMRAYELTIRTNQLNATGYTYSFDELEHFSHSSDHILLMVRLEDKYGEYGNIGLSLIDIKESIWNIKLLLISCRVMSRGIGSVLLKYIINLAKDSKKKLIAEFVPTPRNRMMYITYKFNMFYEYDKKEQVLILKHDLKDNLHYPDYIEIREQQSHLQYNE